MTETLDNACARCQNPAMRGCGDARQSIRPRLFVAFAVVMVGVGLVAPTAYAAPPQEVDIVACPAKIPAHAIGVLQNDVVCSASTAEFPKYGFVLGKNAQLSLNGHTITYQPTATSDGPVLCTKSCRVTDGTITGPGGGSAVHVDGRGTLSTSDLDISGFDYGLFAANSTVNIAHTAIDAAIGGIWFTGKTTLDHVDITVAGPLGNARECVSAISHSGRVLGHDVTVTGCRAGVWGTRSVNLANLTVTNSSIGVFSEHKITLANSAVTGSAVADIYGGSPPKLTNTTCDTSLRFHGKTGSGTWGVCAND